MRKRNEPGLVLNGLDGSNPLGFLAAVGTLRTVALADSRVDWRMKWAESHGIWHPELSAEQTVSQEGLVELLGLALRRESTPEFDFAQSLNVSPERFGKEAYAAQDRASIRDRGYADFMTSFGCEALVTSDGKSIQDTALRTMSGAGHQHFLGTMKQLVEDTEEDHLKRSVFKKDYLKRSLFNTWDYGDEKLGLRWDPGEDRRYALRWENPSGDIVKTVRGANRLAVEALPLLPAIPGSKRVGTTGFTQRDKATLFTWPLWDCPLNLEVIRSLLALAEVQHSEPDRAKLGAMGVVEVYRSRRITTGKFRNFTHAQPA